MNIFTIILIIISIFIDLILGHLLANDSFIGIILGILLGMFSVIAGGEITDAIYNSSRYTENVPIETIELLEIQPNSYLTASGTQYQHACIDDYNIASYQKISKYNTTIIYEEDITPTITIYMKEIINNCLKFFFDNHREYYLIKLPIDSYIIYDENI